LKYDSFIEYLLNSKNEWLKAVVLYTLGLIGDKQFIPKVKENLNTDDKLILENAEFANNKLA